MVTQPLFRRLLGATIEDLAPVLRAAHDDQADQRWTGLADVEASRNPLARLLCRTMGLPAPGTGIPVTVVFERHGASEHWYRDFAGRRYRSKLIERDSFLAIATFAFWALVSWATYLSPRLETLLDGRPQVIVRDGAIIEANLRRDRITRAEVEAEMRLAGIARLSDVAWGILETQGKISFIRRDEGEVQRRDDDPDAG